MQHDTIAYISAFFSVFVFAAVGLAFIVKLWRDYQRNYLEGAATTLDSMYVAMPAQNILYMGAFVFVFVAACVSLLSGNIVVGLVFGIPAFLVPRLILYILKIKRDELFGLQLVDTLMNISNSLRAGFTLPQALDLVHREMPDPMSQEIRLVSQELRLGVTIDEALENLYKRMPSPDLDLLVTAIAIVRDVGGNLSEVFDNLAHTIRERHRIEGKIRALTAQGKMQAIVVCALPFLVGGGLFVVSPGLFAPMISTVPGWVMIGAIIMMEVIGGLIIRKIVNIDI